MRISRCIILICGLSWISIGCLFEGIPAQLKLYEDSNSMDLVSDGTKLYRSFYQIKYSSTASTEIESIDLTSGTRTTILGGPTTGTVDGTGTAAKFSSIYAMALDGQSPQSLYIADTCVLRKAALSTMVVTTVAGVRSNCNDADGTGTGATFFTISGLLTYGNSLLISTTVHIKAMDLTTMQVTRLAGPSTGIGFADGSASNARFSGINGMSRVGNFLYVIETGNQRVRKISLSDYSVTTLAGNGTAASVDGVGTSAQFNFTSMSRVTTDGAQYLYVTETSAIRKIDVTTGSVSTLVQSSGVQEDRDGSLTDVKMYYPSGIVFDLQGLFFSNYYGVRRLR